MYGAILFCATVCVKHNRNTLKQGIPECEHSVWIRDSNEALVPLIASRIVGEHLMGVYIHDTVLMKTRGLIKGSLIRDPRGLIGQYDPSVSKTP